MICVNARPDPQCFCPMFFARPDPQCFLTPNVFQSLAQLLVRAHPEQRRELIAKFHDCAGKIPYPDDADIGALFLEDAGDKAQDSEQKKFLYQEAYFRASWCADSGTSGGECLARSKHLDRVNDKLRSA